MTSTNLPTPVDLVKRADRGPVPAAPAVPTVEQMREAVREDRPTRHRIGDPGKVHVTTYAGYRPRRRGLARLFAGGAR